MTGETTLVKTYVQGKVRKQSSQVVALIYRWTQSILEGH